MSPPSPDSKPIEQLLEELRDRTERLVEEVLQLRAENRRMKARIDELEELVETSGTLLPLDDEPDELRDRIEEFIEVIDRRLSRVQEHSS